MPDKATRTRMWTRNPDGAGIMYAKGGYVYIEKGFMSLAAMEKRLDSLSQHVNLTDVPVILHYRITTHGGTNPQCTHPFPVTNNIRNLKATRTRTKLAVAHNGIINIKVRPGISDTMEFTADVLATMPKGFTKDTKALHHIEAQISGSRLCLLDGAGRITRIGNWYAGDDGCWYSNLSYEAPRHYDFGSFYGNAKSVRFKSGKGKGKVVSTPTPAPYSIDTIYEDAPYSYHTGDCYSDADYYDKFDDDGFLAHYMNGECTLEDLPWDYPEW